ncbi:hypothetical protein MLD38_025983 [Melastoma candidum]|uniref:Uncharacterized protein n=1 Tax=Melastoma candidum TaxID=119954 RepID=A0ACB9NY22_9MYRT|nr:hypothetical protein MLD38_025983 [Melastoma candidum]
MADYFLKQAKQYALARPNYPPELFRFIASKTPIRDLVWDVGTGSGQAAQSLAEIYKNVVATDTSPKQLEFAPKLPNIRYEHTSPVLSMLEFQEKVAPVPSSLDLITIAQALHWFDLSEFYQLAKWALKKPDGVIAAWCYTVPEVDGAVDEVFGRFYAGSRPYWDPARKLVDDRYSTVDFPFEPVSGLDNTGPVRFVTEREMDIDDFFTYIRSWSSYQTAKEQGVEMLNEEVVEEFKAAWNADGLVQKSIKYPVYLRIGRVGN